MKENAIIVKATVNFEKKRKKHMKKILPIILILAALLTACGPVADADFMEREEIEISQLR